MGSNEKFCLRWNDFESNISLAFQNIRDEKDFFDITLSCGQKQIQAHKLILSACSPFFRSVLKQNPHQHPLLYLKGVEFSDLQSVLNFMYHGEVNIAQEDLNSFLSVDEDLQVKGLTQNNSSAILDTKPAPPPASAPRPRPVARTQQAAPTPRPAGPVAAARSSNPIGYSAEPDDIQEIVPLPVVKTEPQPPAVASTERGRMDEQSSMMDSSMGREVASMEESYEEEGYDDYRGYEGQGYDEGEDGQGYGGQEYEGDGTAGPTGENSF